jgi:hypothetical protein
MATAREGDKRHPREGSEQPEIDHTRKVLAKAQLRTPLGDDDLHEIMSHVSSDKRSDGPGHLAAGSLEDEMLLRAKTPTTDSVAGSSSSGSRGFPTAKRGGELWHTPQHRMDGTPSSVSARTPGDADIELAGELSGWGRAATASSQPALVQVLERRIRQAEDDLEAERRSRRSVELSSTQQLTSTQTELKRATEEALSLRKQLHEANTVVKELRRALGAQHEDAVVLLQKDPAELLESLGGEDPLLLSVPQLVALQFAEAVLPMKRQVSQYRAEARASKEKEEDALAACERERLAHERRTRTAEARAEDLADQARAAVEAMERAKRDAAEAVSRARSHEDKAAAHDRAVAEAKAAVVSNSSALKRVAKLEAEAESLRADRTEGRERETRAVRRAELLDAESKAARSAEARALEDLHRARTALETCEEELRRERALSAELRTSLSTAKEDARREAQARADGEVRRLREETAGEIARMREAAREAKEAELSGLREGKEALAADHSTLRVSHEALRREHAETLGRLREAESRSQASVGELRGELRVLQVQLETARLQQQEAQEGVAEARAEASGLRDKLQAAREELGRACGVAERERARLEARVHSLQERLDAYDAMEGELDAVVLKSGEALAEEEYPDDFEDLEDSGKRKEGGRGMRDLSVEGMPTLARRRIAQSVALARRALEAENRLKRAQHELGVARAEMDKEVARGDRLERLIRDASKPQEFVVRRLQDLEENLEATRAALERAERRADSEADRAREEAEARLLVQADLGRVLANRKALEEMQQSLREALLSQRSSGLEQMRRELRSAKKGEDESDSNSSASAGRKGQGSLPSTMVREIEQADSRMTTPSAPRVRAVDPPIRHTSTDPVSTGFVVETFGPSGAPLPRWYRKERAEQLL